VNTTNSHSNAMPEPLKSQVVVEPAVSGARTLYWSIRRELWENRFVYVAPLSVAAVAIVAFSISAIAGIWEEPLRLDPTGSYEAMAMPYNLVASMMMLLSILVSMFYCLDGLHGERRDRSILFWKSLPVSDLTSVLAKVSIPLLVLPLLLFAIVVAMHWVMLLVSSAVLLASGQSVGLLWTKLSVVQMWLLLLYHMVTAHAIWPLPIYCWLLLVSGWARRATFLWAALPLVAIAVVEKIMFHSYYFASLVGRRLIGDAPIFALTQGEKFPTGPMTHVTMGAFLTSPGFWGGMVVAALFLAAAAQLRRYQGPI
jgi:ABC-2 type transport system permease protein